MAMEPAKRIDQAQAAEGEAHDFVLTLDAFVRSIRVKRSTPHALFIGAGASISSGVPSAEKCIWEWKRSIFLTSNPGMEDQFSELTLPSVQKRIQDWLDRQGGFPASGTAEEYGFYIQRCYPIIGDRRAFFQEKVRTAKPHVGYRLVCHLAQTGLIRSFWSTNFDSLPARSLANFQLTPIEIGIDSQHRLPRTMANGEICCVSMHGDYRYDALKNTAEELQAQEKELRQALIEETKTYPLIISGYSGRDESIMEALEAAYGQRGGGTLYWCGFGDVDVPEPIAKLIKHARANGHDAFYVPSQGFDDLATRLALHCLDGETRETAKRDISQLTPQNLLDRTPFQVPALRATTLIKSNAFEIECPAEVLQFDLKVWPAEKVWQWLRQQTSKHSVVAVPLRGKVLALGLIDDIREIFGENIKGNIERVPVAPEEYGYEDGAIVRLMREALCRSMAERIRVPSDQSSEIWFPKPVKTVKEGDLNCIAYESVLLFLRRIGNVQYLVLKPSIKILDEKGALVPHEIASPIKLGILGWQHNKPFNQAVNKWRSELLPKTGDATFEFPVNSASTFKFKVRRSPIFAEISQPGAAVITPPAGVKPLLKHRGIELSEPELLFSNKGGSGTVKDTHPVRGLVTNRPYDFSLTAKGLVPTIRVAVVCPRPEAKPLASYLANAQQQHTPAQSERDYLVDYPGFQQSYGLPLEVPNPGQAGWAICPEPTESDPRRASIEVARNINNAIQSLQSSFAPNVVLVFFPERWNHLRGFSGETERFDVHDFVKAFCVQRGVATQFLNQSTLADKQQCRVWWWLSLALYVKSMRTPWVLNNLSDDTAFVGLGFSVDRTAERGKHVVLGCSHIYSARGEGLQYRLSKVEDPIMRGKNPFMSKDDARRVGETIRELFFDSRMKLPDRVVLHKRTPFRREEREGLLDGLGGVNQIDMLEIQTDNALRYVASQATKDGIDEDNYPVRRGTVMQLDPHSALLWVHGATQAVNPRMKYFQGKRRIPAPLTIRRHVGKTDLKQISDEILGLSKMNWNTFDLYTKDPATLQSSNEIARIGSLLQRFGSASYDYRLFI
jgi:hypothetical protein